MTSATIKDTSTVGCFGVTRSKKQLPSESPALLDSAYNRYNWDDTSKGSGKVVHTLNEKANEIICCSNHNVHRQAMLAYGQAIDHLGNVLMTPDPGFDTEKTIFKTLDSRFPRAMIRVKTGNRLFWSEQRAQLVQQACEKYVNSVPRSVRD